MKTRRLPRGLTVRPFDLAVAGAALVVLWPLLAIVALLILLTDGPPVLFRQTRIGREGVPFLILKFRTMRGDGGGPAITAAGDLRITKLGAWLRQLKIDELPQLINVLMGDMSLIGPRPEVPEYVQWSDQRWQEVLGVRPGITDLASLTFRNEEALLGAVSNPEAHYRSVILPEKLRLNLQYEHSRSLSRDLKLLWLTGRYSLFPRGFSRERILRSLRA
jgi:lipopolysaccharide/colanic/teichoic acid biosynthesis glycosyltransferase